MKKFVITMFLAILVLLGGYIGMEYLGWYVDIHPNKTTDTIATVEGDKIYLTGQEEPFVFKGVNIGSGLPGEWSTTYAITKDKYLEWFQEIQDLGANTIRIYAVLNPEFYDALYEFNIENDQPLYLIQGVWLNDKIQNSHRDAFDEEFCGTFQKDCLMAVDVIHGNRAIFTSNTNHSSGTYGSDVSPWVLGYIVGVEWEDVTVAYTDEKHAEDTCYEGDYLYTSKEASPFERMLTEVGDTMISYETKKYHTQRLLAYANWPTTDPLEHSEELKAYFQKCASVDVEHIKSTNQFIAGQFASYHVYPYYPDYLNFEDNPSQYADANGDINTYQAYLKLLTEHHTMPVVISEFGVSTGRGMAQRDENTGRNQGNMSEKDQGAALISCYDDIINSGCQGGMLFSWQDEWFKRTWNTMMQIDLKETPFWSDYQTNEQYFGLLSFDPGTENSICYVDGDISEWKDTTPVITSDDSSLSVSMMYDEKFIYFLLYKKDYNPQTDTLYIPIDTTPKSGSDYCENYNLKFERAADFLMVIQGEEDSHLLVQERYEVLRAMYGKEVYGINPYENPPAVNSPIFKSIDLVLQMENMEDANEETAENGQYLMETYETGLLRYGNANPSDADFDSLADYITNGDYTEVRIPWQLLNFNAPSKMQIHDDYYNNYGVETINIDQMYVGISSNTLTQTRTNMGSFALKAWDTKVTYHERLKQSYYILQKYWNTSDEY